MRARVCVYNVLKNLPTLVQHLLDLQQLTAVCGSTFLVRDIPFSFFYLPFAGNFRLQ